MATTLFLSPSLDSALNHVAERIAVARREDPLLPVYLLAPTVNSLQAARQRLGATMGIHFYQFYSLGQGILDAAGMSMPWLNDTTVRRLVHHLLGEMNSQDELTTFAPVWDKPGFNQSLVDWLREMKSQGIFPEDYAAHTEGNGLDRDRQLALIYLRYQRFLQERDLSDADGLLWLAAEALEQNPELFSGAGLFLALGFDQFNPVQERILRALAGRFNEFDIYLPWDARRSESSLALSRLVETRRRLEAFLPDVQAAEIDEPGEIAALLHHLRDTLFEVESGYETREGDESEETSAVRAFAAPNREIEVRIALREIKRLLLQGVSADEITLLAPKPGVYQRLVELIAEEYGVPVRLEQALLVNPAVQALLNLLALPADFPWRKTLDALRSPYIRQSWLTSSQVDQLERLSRERPVLRGRAQWRYALEPIQRVSGPDDSAGIERAVEDEDLGPPRLASLLSPEELEAIRDGLMAFFDHLTPPETATHHAYTLWLQERILGLQAPVEDEGDEPSPGSAILDLVGCAGESVYAERDMQALSIVLQHLRALVNAAELVTPGDEGRIPWAAYRSDLLNVLPSLHIPADPLANAVRFDRLEAGRERPVDHLFVLGLSEGEFPSPPQPDVFYTPSERQWHPLPLRRLRPADDASVWWLVLANCRRSLTLLRPRLDENGAPWEPSPYWDEVIEKTRVPVVDIPVGYCPGLEDAASPAELLVALAVNQAQAIPASLGRAWQAAQAAFQVMRLRQSWTPAPAFEGHIQANDLQQELAQHYDVDYTWSASRLNRYGMCPFGFFAQYVLQLEERPDPDEGLDAMQRGSLLHALLERLHRRLSAEGLTLSPEHQAAILQHLDEVCSELFSHAPARYGFRPTALWRYEQQELVRMLRALVIWECAQTHAYRPYQQELRFGVAGAELPSIPFEDAQGTTFYLHGVIDRVDRDESSGSLRVLDYKSGRTAYAERDIREGRALQAPLYALAVERLLGERVAESAYLLIPKRELSGKLNAQGSMMEDETAQAAVDQAGWFVRQIQNGAFPSLPSKPSSGNLACSTYCEYISLCRVSRQAIAKARRGGG